MKTKLLFTLCILTFFSVRAQHIYPPQKALWNPDSLGNQRAVIVVNDKNGLVRATIPWRNRNVTFNQRLIIVDSLSEREITPTVYLGINEKEGSFIFDPLSGPGIYYVYYLPYKLGGRSKYYPDAEYLKRPLTAVGNGPVEKIKNKAVLLRIESVDVFNNNDPMEFIATQTEIKAFTNKHSQQTYVVFPEDRCLPIRMSNYLPQRWMEEGFVNDGVKGTTDRGCFYAFQLGLWSVKQSLENVQVSFSSLKGENGATIAAEAFQCINTDGVSYLGKKMKLQVRVPKGNVQALWCGAEIPATIAPGIYKGTVTIKPANAEAQLVPVTLRINAAVAEEQAVDKPWLQTRLPWLNSTLAQENTVIKPYEPLQIVGDSAVSLLGRKIVIAKSGFPKQIQTYFTEEMTTISNQPNNLLFEPIHFHFQQQANKKDIPFKSTGFTFTQKEEGTVAWKATNSSDAIQMDVKASLEFDGFLSYTVKVIALKTVELADIAMHIPYQPDKATYLMGLGQKGGYRPERVAWKWDVANKNQDGAWIGNVNAGIQFSLRDENYARPLNTNFYLQKPLVLPKSWGNENKGGIDVGIKGGSMLVNNYSGSRTMKQGDTLYFNFNLLTTPFHPLNTEEHWNDRFYHAYKPIDTVKASGANVINIHHGTAINPYINYPFIATKEMKAYIDSAHHEGVKVKIYNTIREVSNRMYELYPMRSLGQEVFSSGIGRGYSWLQEHLDSNYIAAWYVPEFKDAAIINSGMNRWHNYYVEGMNWLIDHIGIDGIYLDDVAFDRVTMKRIKRVMTKDGHPGIIDLHSANQYNKNDGFNNSANLYMEHFPYINRLWFGEYFDYENSGPDFFLTEISGIPFGLMGEMLQDGGNPWRGMIYGMTNRLGWSKKTPLAIWKTWDDFGIKGSKMIGYWVQHNPVKVDRKDILATTYQKENKVMIALASWATSDVQTRLNIDWQRLGINPKKAKIMAPAIEGFQPAQEFKLNESIPVAKNKGWLLIIQ